MGLEVALIKKGKRIDAKNVYRRRIKDEIYVDSKDMKKNEKKVGILIEENKGKKKGTKTK